MLDKACSNGNIEIVDFLMLKGIDFTKEGLQIASRIGNVPLLLYMISKGATNFNQALGCACYNNSQEIVNILISKGANDFNLGLEKACEGRGSTKLVKLMISKGATTNLNYALKITCLYNKIKISKLLILAGANNLDKCLGIMCEKFYDTVNEQRRKIFAELITLMLSKGAKHCNKCKFI